VLCPLEYFSPLWTIWGSLALGFKNKYSNKIVAKNATFKYRDVQ